MAFQRPGYRPFEPDAKEDRVARLRHERERLNIWAINELRVERPVEQQQKLIVGVRNCHAPDDLVRISAKTLQAAGQQKAGVYGDLHSLRTTEGYISTNPILADCKGFGRFSKYTCMLILRVSLG